MAIELCVVITDDLDGTPGAETVKFSVGSVVYEIDLGLANRQRLHESLQPFTNAGRRIRWGQPPAARTDLAEIRAWAQAQGLHVRPATLMFPPLAVRRGGE